MQQLAQALSELSFDDGRVVIDTTQQSWQSSPVPGVLRKRLYHPGSDAESGVVTSLVRYQAGAEFPSHSHPGGEEVLVLEGTFSDEQGDWPQGTLLLNPEGFSHRPFSREGCLLLVRLQQYVGQERHHLALNLALLPWQTCSLTGIERKQLYGQNAYPDWLEMELWPSCCEPGLRVYQGGAELYVLEGVLSDGQGHYGAGSWLRFPVGGSHRPFSEEGCVLYIKQGGIRAQAVLK